MIYELHCNDDGDKEIDDDDQYGIKKRRKKKKKRGKKKNSNWKEIINQYW